MSGSLRAVAGLPQVRGGLSVRLPGRGSIEMAYADGRPEMTTVVVSGDEAEDYVRILAAAPLMLAFLASLLGRWEQDVEAGAEINGGDAVEWLAAFTRRVHHGLQGTFNLWPPERMP